MELERKLGLLNSNESNNKMIIINLDKAKEIKKQMLRADRASILQSLDVEFQKALESGLDTSHIVAEKQRLRDITKLVDDCKSVDELFSIVI